MGHFSGSLVQRENRTFALLDQFVSVLAPGSNNVFFWPFLEGNGDIVQPYGTGIDEELDVTAATSTLALDAADTGYHPVQHVGGIHSYHFEDGDSQALVGADAATLSFNGSTDTAFTVGCFFYTHAAAGTLLAKYDVLGSA